MSKMNRVRSMLLLRGLAIVVLVSLFSACAAVADDEDPTALSSAKKFENALEAISGGSATVSVFDSVLNPENARAVDPSSFASLKKYVLGDYYASDISDIAGTVIVGTVAGTNNWGAQDPCWARTDDVSEEDVYSVTAGTALSDEIIALYQVAGTDGNGEYAGKFHVYRYYLWKASGDYGNTNIWYGNSHVFYMAPVQGKILAGQPYLELFPASASSSVVREARIEKTSFFEYKGVHAGNTDSDLGSSLTEANAVFGALPEETPVASMNDIVWASRNQLYTYTNGGYVHYENLTVSCRVFFAHVDTQYRVIAMYYVNR